MKARFFSARYLHIVVLSLLAGILYLGAYFFVDTFRINRIWMDRVEIPSALAFDEATFDFLVDGGAIWPWFRGLPVTPAANMSVNSANRLRVNVFVRK